MPLGCEPQIEILEKYVLLPSDMTQINPLPPVPSNGDNSDLLEWALSCANVNNLNQLQLRRIRSLQENRLGETDVSR